MGALKDTSGSGAAVSCARLCVLERRLSVKWPAVLAALQRLEKATRTTNFQRISAPNTVRALRHTTSTESFFLAHLLEGTDHRTSKIFENAGPSPNQKALGAQFVYFAAFDGQCLSTGVGPNVPQCHHTGGGPNVPQCPHTGGGPNAPAPA